MSKHECDKVLSKVYLALDGAMSREEEKAFLTDLRKCSCCLDHYNIEQVFKHFLTEKIERKQVSKATIDQIRVQIETISVSDKG